MFQSQTQERFFLGVELLLGEDAAVEKILVPLQLLHHVAGLSRLEGGGGATLTASVSTGTSLMGAEDTGAAALTGGSGVSKAGALGSAVTIAFISKNSSLSD